MKSILQIYILYYIPIEICDKDGKNSKEKSPKVLKLN